MVNYETYIGRIIYDKIPIEWMRFNMYVEEDKYRSIPMLVFILHSSCSCQQINILKNYIESFNGNMKWTIFNYPSSKNKYLLTISELKDWYKINYTSMNNCSQAEFWGEEKYRIYCDLAISDIPNLAKKIEEALSIL